jgi:hypothetical protein
MTNRVDPRVLWPLVYDEAKKAWQTGSLLMQLPRASFADTLLHTRDMLCGDRLEEATAACREPIGRCG